MSKKVIIMMVAVFSLLAVPAMVSFESEDLSADGVTLIDSRGVTLNLSEPATHVASFGAFCTNTLISIGKLDSAAVLDAGSKYSSSGIEEVKDYSDDMFVTVSGANKDQVLQKMQALYAEGKWDKGKDVIIGYGYASYMGEGNLWNILEADGFKVFACYPSSYDGIVDVVLAIEKITGTDNTASENMKYVKTYISETLEDKGITTKVTCIYVSFSSGILKLANTGSVTADFIEYAGGDNIAEDSAKTSPTYSSDIGAVKLMKPQFVLLDGYYVGTAQDFADELDDSSIGVLKMEKDWNTYCPKASEGLWNVACLLYPEIFEGDIPVMRSQEPDNTWVYAGVAVTAIAAISIAAVYFVKRR